MYEYIILFENILCANRVRFSSCFFNVYDSFTHLAFKQDIIEI